MNLMLAKKRHHWGILLLYFMFDVFSPTVVLAGAESCVDADYLYARNTSETEKYLDAVMHGDAVSQNRLGLMYYEGVGVNKDAKEAMKWFSKSAHQGYSKAQYNLAQTYYLQTDMVGNQDYEALLWFKKAADLENVDAQFAVGMMYFGYLGSDEKLPARVILDIWGQMKITDSFGRAE